MAVELVASGSGLEVVARWWRTTRRRRERRRGGCLVLRDVRLADAKPDQPATDIGVKDGRIAAIAPRLGGGAGEQVQERTLAPRPVANFRRSTGPRTGHFALSGRPTAPIASATDSPVCASWWRRLCGAFGAGPRGLPDGRKVYLRCVRPRDRHFSRYSFLNTRSGDFPEIGAGGRARYAALQVPVGVAHAMNGPPQVRKRFPSRSLKPIPTHTQRLRLHSTRTN
jgi:hypothetical protein